VDVGVTRVVTGLDIAHRIDQKFPGAVVGAMPEGATLKAGSLLDACTFLRDEPDLRFEFLSSLTGVDCLDSFEVVYHIESIRLNLITCLKVKTYDRENPRVPSVCPVWPGANLQERDAYDLLGIHFEGHPDLRRIFLWDGFAGFPLRKDYLNMPGGLMAGLERFPGEPGGKLEGRG
jgi:NADH-quinone oxidoreductase subunit C